ncbi:hypothetical membrane protein [Thermoplasma acidophilum]|uniref:Hypothetical membrane protein n=1 Tax=Thermoplasma acidophilum (strain ATCC 25905 / DSM 1728 / JCM 9062 / NBRC 15155 / AMRC-C165) TaxID=273075 RepID=Q9HKL2_THEAC|nr:hypothetical membrane protein [Thermoplasma acidophilum]
MTFSMPSNIISSVTPRDFMLTEQTVSLIPRDLAFCTWARKVSELFWFLNRASTPRPRNSNSTCAFAFCTEFMAKLNATISVFIFSLPVITITNIFAIQSPSHRFIFLLLPHVYDFSYIGMI